MERLERLTGVVIDVETGSLNPETGALLEVAMIAVRNGDIAAKWVTRVQPQAGLTVDPDAARVNGYDPGTWGGAWESATMASMVEFLRWFQGSSGRKKLTWIGTNVPFDRNFLAAAGRRHGVAHAVLSSFDHRDVDVARMAMFLVLDGTARGTGLDVLRRELLGLGPRDLHGALSDCEDTLACLRALVALWRRPR
jgi:DNA polymerase III epsilon subunit-like protein